MPYDEETGKHYPYTDEGKEQYEKETGRGVPMKNTAYWKAKSGVASPALHVGSGTSGPNQKYHHQPYGPEGPIKGRSYPAVMPRSAGDPTHKPGETPNSKDDGEKRKNRRDKAKESQGKTWNPISNPRPKNVKGEKIGIHPYDRRKGLATP